MDFTGLVKEAAEKFNGYSKIKNSDTGFDREKMLTETLIPAARTFLDACRVLEAMTECKAERNVLRQFAEELTRIF